MTVLPNVNTAPLHEYGGEVTSTEAPEKEFTLQVEVDVEDNKLSWL